MIYAPALLIFDVDGTLTYSARLTRLAFDLAAKEIYSIDDSTRGIIPFGRTDQGIFREILKNNDLPESNFSEQFKEFSLLSAYHLERELNASNKPRLHTGVFELLKALTLSENIYLALGTGNIKRNAYIKLARHGVDHLFPVGGFGSDDEDRTAFLDIAYGRAIEFYGIEFEKRNTWVIGDTPLDIINGRNIGARTIAVATGNFNEEELSEHNPDAVFPNLNDWDRFITLIQNNNLSE